jgi:anthranilate phosphoribosyltransferase
MTSTQPPQLNSRIGIRALVAAVGQGPTNGRYLTHDEAQMALEAIMDGVATRAQAGALLLLQRYRSEAPEELVGYVDAVRGRMAPFAPAVDGMLDIGSPYDGRSKHIVISPAASIVAAAAGVPVLMHGERGMGPKLGLPVGDVLTALAVDTDAVPDVVARGIETCGLGYIRQARLVPDLYALKPLREELGLRTPLHIVEKIYSPGRAPYHLIGVAHMPYLKQLAPALQPLGFRRTMVVQGIEGHEDVTTSRGARVIEIDENGSQHEWRLDPRALGLIPAGEDDLAHGDAERSATMTLEVLKRQATPARRDLVVLNAALRIKLAGRAADMASALASARQALDSGAAYRKLEAWRTVR